MRSLAELETPAVLIDLDVVERNISRMAEHARDHGVRLRPHAKTHKLPEIGRKQLAAGAVGLTVAKPGEAEVFAAAGFDDIFIAYPVVGVDKARRLLALADQVQLSVGVDSVDGARTLGDPFHAAGKTLDVKLKIEVGARRVGVLPERALEVGRAIAELPGLRLTGLYSHAGQAYSEKSPQGVAAVGRHEGETTVAVAEAFRAAGLTLDDVSVGSTPTARHAMAVPGVTECRPGTYVYYDATQVSLGVCAPEDCALTVLATVVSTPDPTRAVLDAGSKTLSSDPLRPGKEGRGLLRGYTSRIARLSEEHGVVAVHEGESFRVGDRVRILPNHACVVSNLHDVVHGVRGDNVETELAVAARGKVT